MGTRLLPRSLPELFSHAILIEREATKRFAELEKAMRDAGLDHLAEEFESIGREEREQFEALTQGTAGHDLPEVPEWEFDWYFQPRPQGWKPRKPRSAREALGLALSTERRAQNFYSDVAEASSNDALSAFAAEMAADETRHIQRLEQLLAREPRY
jgi:rubrerythrin